MNFLSLSGLIIIFTSIVLICLLLIYGKTKLHRAWLWLNFAVLIWGIGTFLAGKAVDIRSAAIGWAVACIGGYFIAATFYHTVCVFCSITRTLIIKVIYSFAFLFSHFAK